MRKRLCWSAPGCALLALGGCISSGPPAPPLRWLDPLARFEVPAVGSAVTPLRLRAQPHLSQEVAVRTQPAVVVYDADHRWLVSPEELVRRAFGRAQVPLGAGDAEHLVELQTFEMQQLEGAPAARVVCTVKHTGRAAASPGVRVEVVAPAEDASRRALTDAMRRALQELVVRVMAEARS